MISIEKVLIIFDENPIVSLISNKNSLFPTESILTGLEKAVFLFLFIQKRRDLFILFIFKNSK